MQWREISKYLLKIFLLNTNNESFEKALTVIYNQDKNIQLSY